MLDTENKLRTHQIDITGLFQALSVLIPSEIWTGYTYFTVRKLPDRRSKKEPQQAVANVVIFLCLQA